MKRVLTNLGAAVARGVLTFAIVAFALVAIAAVSDVHQWQLPVGFYNAGVRQARIDQSGNGTLTGALTAASETLTGALTAASASVTGAITVGSIDSIYSPGTISADGGFFGHSGYAIPSMLRLTTAQGFARGSAVVSPDGGLLAGFGENPSDGGSAFSSAPTCICTDATAANAFTCNAPDSGVIFIAGTIGDRISFLCSGNAQ